MKVKINELFTPKVNKNCLYEKFTNLFEYRGSTDRVHLASDMNKITFTQISLIRGELEKIAKKGKTEFTFMQHKNSDSILMNCGPHTSLFDWSLSQSEIVEKANELLAKCNAYKH